MAMTVLLVRHAAHPLVGRVLCGRMPGVRLDEGGRRSAAQLGPRLRREAPVALHASPQDRCLETAAAIGQACGLDPRPDDALDEIDFGAWTGAAFERLADDPAWAGWNARRAESCPPGGESMRQAQLRAVAGLQHLRARHPGGVVVAVSHADVIKAMLMWCLGLTLDAHQAFDIDPASVSALRLWDGGGKVLWMNEKVAG
ncbi:histidine phosphatase family protein [Roseicella aerolata]|uniref:Histidine phosphatase family protein n=1 Tax=Roseicella aerolata TaxID=2883479 RepID=A0A9X1L9M7_9PROT|nr:histidine phosphatase family protein [Roseicella aerolata]MCB4824141.1 histidine phosphatase family protein [Roseicella aerolata]